jgi:predicted RNase H-like HicB family nuclease
MTLRARPIKLEISGSIWQDSDGIFVSRCDSLDIMSAGDTFESAWQNTMDAIVLYIRSCIADGTIADLMRRVVVPAPLGPVVGTPSEAHLTFDAPALQGARITKSIELS